MQEAIALSRVALLARSYHVVPGMGSALRSGNDVIERQVLRATAVLTGMVVAAEDFPTIDWGYFPVPLWIAARQTNVI